MERYVKVAGIAGGTAFLLSALIGGMFGVGFGVVLVRSIVWTLVFAVLGGGSAYLFDQALVPAGSAPEPVTEGENSAPATSAAGTEEAEEPAIGENVDIVVDDAPVENQFAALAGSSGFVDDEAEEPQPVVPSMVEEVEESQVDDVAAAIVEEESAVQAVPRTPQSESALPDIGGMAGEFVQPIEEAEVDEMDTIPSTGGGADAGGMAGNDPAALAKALQTMLKRD